MNASPGVLIRPGRIRWFEYNPRRYIAGALLVLVLSMGVGCGSGEMLEPVPDRPNLILIIGDDQAYYDYGFMGSSHIRTPNLDRLAEGGTVFPMGYTTASVCRPALVSLLTGLHPFQWYFRLSELRRSKARNFGLPEVQRLSDPSVAHIALSEIQRTKTLPRLLTKHGYATFQGGKYWEGPFHLAGFTDGMARKKGPRSMTDRAGGWKSLALVRSTIQPVYDFIDAHVDTPFFIWFAPMLPHFPYDSPEKFLDLYSDAEHSLAARKYYANISRFDAGVGDLVAYLEAKGLRDRTLIVFVTDNGWQLEELIDPKYKPQGGPKGKMSLYEVGFRTPVIFNAPGWIFGGRVNNALVSSVDLFTTLLDYAGVPQVSDRPGISLRPILEERAESGRDAIIGNMTLVRPDMPEGRTAAGFRAELPPGGFFLRNRRWHYIWNDEGSGRKDQLYNLEEDPDEERNIAEAHPEIVERFRERVLRWKTEMKRPFNGQADEAR